MGRINEKLQLKFQFSWYALSSMHYFDAIKTLAIQKCRLLSKFVCFFLEIVSVIIL